jgi:hypothetical protein
MSTEMFMKASGQTTKPTEEGSISM